MQIFSTSITSPQLGPKEWCKNKVPKKFRNLTEVLFLGLMHKRVDLKGGNSCDTMETWPNSVTSFMNEPVACF